MPIMPAGVHNAGILGCVFCTCLFKDWQGIHIGPQEDDRTRFCSFEQRNNACPSDTGIEFQSELIEFLGDNRGGAFFKEAEFRVGMKISA
jgi:hypothetical protein